MLVFILGVILFFCVMGILDLSKDSHGFKILATIDIILAMCVILGSILLGVTANDWVRTSHVAKVNGYSLKITDERCAPGLSSVLRLGASNTTRYEMLVDKKWLPVDKDDFDKFVGM